MSSKLKLIGYEDTFLIGFQETINKMTGFTVNNVGIEKSLGIGFEISGAMVLSGHTSALLVISTTKVAAGIIVAYMTGADISDLTDEDLYNGVTELVNMTAGIAKANLANTTAGFKLSSPFAVVGSNIDLKIDSFVEKYEYFLSSNDVLVKMGVYYF
jgi:CheY-specific phosphatase CheX